MTEIRIAPQIKQQIANELQWQESVQKHMDGELDHFILAFPGMLERIKSGKLSEEHRKSLQNYAHEGNSRRFGVSMICARFAPLSSASSREARKNLVNTMEYIYKDHPHLAPYFTDCVLDFMSPRGTVRRSLYNQIYELDKANNKAATPQQP